MSPTYATASAIIEAAQRNNWEFIKSPNGHIFWGMRKGNLTIHIAENRRGGLSWVSLDRTHEHWPIDSVLLDHRHRNKREAVLSWIAGDIDWPQYGFRP